MTIKTLGSGVVELSKYQANKGSASLGDHDAIEFRNKLNLNLHR